MLNCNYIITGYSEFREFKGEVRRSFFDVAQQVLPAYFKSLKSGGSMKRFKTSILIVAILSAFAVVLAGCGGGGGGGTTPTTGNPPASTITSYLVDEPVNGLTYVCAPSNLSGVTTSTGRFDCQTGDTAAFSLKVGSATINFGSVTVPSTSGVSVPVTMFPNGLQVAAILQALNHGSVTNIDVSGLSIPASVVADINSYISSNGTLPAGQSSDDQFLSSIQNQTSGATPSFVNLVTGSGKTFQQNVVLPNLQATIIKISATNPPAPVVNNTTKLNGTMLVTGSATSSADGCTDLIVTYRGGGILNAIVNGNIQQPGSYPVTFSSSNFEATTTRSSVTCTSGGVTTTIPGSTKKSSEPPLNETNTIIVTPAFSGNTLTFAINGNPPAGCSGGQLTGTDVGLSNPLITLTKTVNCTEQGATATVTLTAKLVGAW